MTPEEKAKNALLKAHPKALRACRNARRLVRWSGFIFLFGFILLVATRGFHAPRLWDYLSMAEGCVAAASLAVLALAFSLWLVIVTFFFARYSLAQLLGVILIGGACGTAIVSLPQPWGIVAIIMLCSLVLCVIIYILQQDPDQPPYMPAFLRKAMRARKKAAQAAPQPLAKSNGPEHG